MSELNNQLQDLLNQEENKYQIALQSGDTYTKKSYEILEWEIREVSPTEWSDFWADPINADPILQKKYIWVTYEDFEEPEDIIEAPEWYELYLYEWKNLFTGEVKSKNWIRPLPPPPSRKEIGDYILNEKFEGNPHAQITDLLYAVIAISKVLILLGVIPKEVMKQALAPVLPSIELASDGREEKWLSRFDLSFLD